MEIIRINRSTYDIWDVQTGRLAEVLHARSVTDAVSYVVNKYRGVPVTLRSAS